MSLDSVGQFAATLDVAQRSGVRIFTLEAGVIEKVADAMTPQPILAAVRMPVSQLSDDITPGTVVLLHDLRDPGNVGTIIRSADASGASAVVLTGQGVDPFNPKTLRASAGSIFHIPVVVEPSYEFALNWFHERDTPSFATVVRGGDSLYDAPLGSRHVLVIGNEAEGLSVDALSRTSHQITIPMSGKAESLNASVAAALVLFEGQRARTRA